MSSIELDPGPDSRESGPSPGACPALSETLFRAIVGGLFLEARVPNGSIIDAGAHMGFESCYYAGMSPLRTVHAVEPLSSNVAFMKRQYSRSHPKSDPSPWRAWQQHTHLGARARCKTCRGCAVIAHAQLVQGSGPITRGRR